MLAVLFPLDREKRGSPLPRLAERNGPNRGAGRAQFDRRASAPAFLAGKIAALPLVAQCHSASVNLRIPATSAAEYGRPSLKGETKWQTKTTRWISAARRW